MAEKHKHLELIQGVINRLSTNSFLLKGWSVVLVSSLFALTAASDRAAFVVLAYMPVLVFWGLDGYFLWQERLYRRLYDSVRIKGDGEIDFSMDVSAVRTGESPPKWINVVFSRTLVTFHGILIVSVIVVTVVTLMGGNG
ncbi:MAG: hypothetical protein OXG46_01305 [Chloroflexi bacterium]|nr:hypothetical protein [Chloroflexota bacterium]MCY3939188.1 hypothetical protein [Chloroflexota bacterium]